MRYLAIAALLLGTTASANATCRSWDCAAPWTQWEPPRGSTLEVKQPPLSPNISCAKPNALSISCVKPDASLQYEKWFAVITACDETVSPPACKSLAIGVRDGKVFSEGELDPNVALNIATKQKH